MDFFYNDSLDIGRLLIYGLSFAKTEYLVEGFLEKKPEYRNDFHFISIDGHILKRLREMSKENKLKEIIITYYRDDEKDYLEELLRKAGLFKMTTIVHTDEIDVLGVR